MRNQTGQSSMGGSTGFREETRRFLQYRLRVLSGTVTLIIAVLSAAFIANNALDDGSLAGALLGFATTFPNAILALMLGSGAMVHFLLRWRRLAYLPLLAVDALFLQVLVLPSLILYYELHDFSFSGFAYVVPFLMLFILSRAVVVPSTAVQTILISMPAALGVLLVQVARGAPVSAPGTEFSPAYFMDMVIQNQVCLVGAIAVAALASRLNLGLRRRNYDARRVGQYDLGERIGEGSMGEVFLATHSLLKRPTAIKFLRPEIAGREALQRFEAEVRQTSRLSHPNTVSIYDYGQTADGLFYYAMELLDGADLRQIVELTGPMPAARVIHVLSQACGALAEAHGEFLIHRDIKPANLMLCRQGGREDEVKVLDFGLAKNIKAAADQLAQDREVAGTPATVAPEVIRGRAGPTSDLYSLSAVGYYLLTARPLFPFEKTSDFLRAHLEETPLPPSDYESDVPHDLEQVIMRGLEKDASRRFKSALEMREDLLSCQDAACWTQEMAVGWWRDFRARDFSGRSEIADRFSASTLKTLGA